MRIKIENIGILEAADVDFTGIAVIAGHNDTGKSTVSKVAYALVRAMTPSREELLEDREENLKIANEQIVRILRKNISRDNLDNLDTLFSNLTSGPFDQIVETIISKNEVTFPEESRMQLNRWMDTKKKLEAEINERGELNNQSKSTYFERKIYQFLQHEFKLLRHVPAFTSDTSISLYANSDEANFKVTLNSEFLPHMEIPSLAFKSDISPLVTDVFYIGTPFVMDDTKSFQRKWESKSDYLHYHLQGAKRTVLNNDAYQEILERIKQIMHGEIIYQNGEYSYKKIGAPVSFAMKNTATGIKTFGIIQMLLENRHIDSGTLLIIDEPEVHLHPDWQVKLAEILVLMSQKLNIPILLSTHAPFFLEAINLYALTYKYDSFVKYYLAKYSENKFDTSRINPAEFADLLSELAEPFGTLEKLDMALYKDDEEE